MAPLRGAGDQAHHPAPRGESSDLGRNEGQNRANAVIVGALAYVGPGGDGAHTVDCNLPASSNVPAGAIIVGSKQVGTVEWQGKGSVRNSWVTGVSATRSPSPRSRGRRACPAARSA